MAMNLRRAETAATGVGVLTLAIGGVLLAAPARIGQAAGLTGNPDLGLRVIGVVDLAIAAGLLWGRPRWPWMAARAAANPPTAAYAAMLGRRDDVPVLAGVAVALLGATVADIAACRALREAGR